VGFEMVDTIAEAEGISMNSVSFKALFGKGSKVQVAKLVFLISLDVFGLFVFDLFFICNLLLLFFFNGVA
jgi:hypothetical protein